MSNQSMIVTSVSGQQPDQNMEQEASVVPESHLASLFSDIQLESANASGSKGPNAIVRG